HARAAGTAVADPPRHAAQDAPGTSERGASVHSRRRRAAEVPPRPHTEAGPLSVRVRLRWMLPALGLVAALVFPASGRAGAVWYDFNEPYASATGPDALVYDWSTQRCGDDMAIPDQPARAFRDANDQVNLIASHWGVRSEE